MVQLAPSRVWQETSFLPFALPDPIDRIYTYRLGAQRFVGPWIPASASGTTATSLLDRVYRGATTRIGASGTEGVIVDRPLTARERGRFRTLADLYRDADVLVAAAGHPACAGLTVAQARGIARGTITRWSQVAPGASADAIRVRHLVSGFGDAVPHLGTRWVGRLNTAARELRARGGRGRRRWCLGRGGGRPVHRRNHHLVAHPVDAGRRLRRPAQWGHAQ